MIPLRDDIRSGRFPLITISLIAANVFIYIYQLSLGPAQEYFIWKYAIIAKTLTSFHPIHPSSTLLPPLTLITSQFLHGGFLHLAGNMLFLWIFGDNVEAKLGYVRYLIFYITCGVISGLVQVLTFPHADMPLIGASGAIAGVMGAYFIRFPRAHVYTLIIIWIVRLPAVIFLGLWFIYQLLNGAPTYGSAEGGVAYFAHIGGFIAGMVLFKLWKKYN
jgi:membrane associated rhomboid family serine protease